MSSKDLILIKTITFTAFALVAFATNSVLCRLALGGLSATQAAVVQLSVPVIAALGGVIFVSEKISLRLTISALLVLGGILMVVLGKYYETLKPNVKT